MRISDWSSDVCSSDLFCAGLAHVGERFEWRLWAYCLMDNHYHLLVETRQPTLSRGMREVNSVYTQAFNRSEERRVGKECVSTCRSRWSPDHSKKEKIIKRVSKHTPLNHKARHR